MSPSEYRKAAEYSQKKLENIDKAVLQVKEVIRQQSLEAKDVIAVSSYINWGMDNLVIFFSPARAV